MGDRTYCTLRIAGMIKPADADRLAKAISNMGPDDFEPLAELATGGSIGFQEINYGNIDDTLRDLLEELSLSYAWTWCAGGEYPEGIELYDASTAERANYTTAGSEIVPHLSEAEDPAARAAARRRADFEFSQVGLTIAESAPAHSVEKA